MYHPALGRELSPTDALRVVDHCVDANIGLIHFYGGEPFVRRDFPTLIAYCDERGVATSITTNATLLNQAAIDKLAGLRQLRSIFVSFEDIREAAHDAIRGRGSYHAALQGLELASTLPGVTTSVSFTLNRPAMEDLDPHEIIAHFARMGASRVIFQDLAYAPEPSPEVQGLIYGRELWCKFLTRLYDPKSTTAVPFVYELKPLVIDYLNRTIGTTLPVTYYGCNGLSTEFRLLPTGVLLPCSAAVGWAAHLNDYTSTPSTLANTPLHELLESDLYRRFLAMKREQSDPSMTPCHICRYAYRRCNPCVFGRLTRESHSVQMCAWVAEVDRAA